MRFVPVLQGVTVPLLLCACQHYDADSPKAASARLQFVQCLGDAVPKLDDGRSDAATVGIAVAAACGAQANDWARAAANGDVEFQNDMQHEIDSKAAGMATALVLRYRREKSTGQ